VNQETIIKSLMAVAIAGLIALIGYSTFVLFYTIPERSEVGAGEQPATLEENEALKATIDTLEIMWENRQSYVFDISQDPLHLGRVIKDFKYASGGDADGMEDSEIRLSATVVDSNPKAIIKYNGKSYVVQIGDLIGTSYRVLKIEKMQVILDHNGQRVVLETKRAAEGDDSIDDSAYSNATDYGDYNY